MSKLKLFCFPYAGGSAAVFNGWRKYCSDSIELVPVELAGRGRRIGEPMIDNIDDLVDDVFRVIVREINENNRYVLFGHSLGALIVYGLANKIRELSMRQPEHIFFSGHGAPHVLRPDEKIYHLMNAEEFRNEVITLGGTPPEFFEHKELMQLFLPLLKNDFKVAETKPVNQTIRPFEVDITVFQGSDDNLTPEQSDGWKKYTTKLCSIFYFKGGHFFIHKEYQAIIRMIESVIRETARKDRVHLN